jgi:hypothetical protein
MPRFSWIQTDFGWRLFFRIPNRPTFDLKEMYVNRFHVLDTFGAAIVSISSIAQRASPDT